MHTIMTIRDQQFILNDISLDLEMMYDDKNEVMRIVIHDFQKEMYNILIDLLHNGEDIKLENQNTIFIMKNAKLISFHENYINGRKLNMIRDRNHSEREYIYELEASEWEFNPVLNLGSGKLLIKRLAENAILPTRVNTTDAGLDLYSIEDVEIESFDSIKIRTGIAVELPHNTYGQYGNRSSLSNKKLLILGGIIDQDYRGELFVTLYNLDHRPQRIYKGDRIAQLIIIPTIFPEVKEVDKLSNTDRGDKGFGSSGR